MATVSFSFHFFSPEPLQEKTMKISFFFSKAATHNKIPAAIKQEFSKCKHHTSWKPEAFLTPVCWKWEYSSDWSAQLWRPQRLQSYPSEMRFCPPPQKSESKLQMLPMAFKFPPFLPHPTHITDTHTPQDHYTQEMLWGGRGGFMFRAWN